MKCSICVVSYKRPNNNTCKLLKDTSLDWLVFVYKFDPFLNEYIKQYGKRIHIIDFEKPNLANKRQYVLDWAIKNEYEYCIMLDDDIESIETETGQERTIVVMLQYLCAMMAATKKYIAISTSYNKSDNNLDIEEYKNVCNNSIFNLQKYSESGVKYNPLSKCEDMEFTIELLKKDYITGRLNNVIVHNTLQGGTTQDGLSYRFSNTNRFVEEGQYMQKKYPELANAFEYDEKHFKLNTKVLLELLKENKK